MWKIDISGKKKAVLLAWTCVIGYEEPEIEYESGTDEAFFLSCSVNTRNDANPFGDNEAVWDGRKADLSQFDEMDIREGKHSLFLNGVGLKQLTGYLSVDIEMKNIPDDGDAHVSAEYHYANGEKVHKQETPTDSGIRSQPDEKEIRKLWKWEKTKDGSGYVIQDYSGRDADIVIPETISNLPVVELAEELFSPNRFRQNPKRRGWFEKSMKSVSIPKTVKTIGKRAFAFNFGLKSVRFAEGVRSIGDEAFCSCKQLTAVTLPGSVVEIGETVFSQCEK